MRDLSCYFRLSDRGRRIDQQSIWSILIRVDILPHFEKRMNSSSHYVSRHRPISSSRKSDAQRIGKMWNRVLNHWFRAEQMLRLHWFFFTAVGERQKWLVWQPVTICSQKMSSSYFWNFHNIRKLLHMANDSKIGQDTNELFTAWPFLADTKSSSWLQECGGICFEVKCQPVKMYPILKWGFTYNLTSA